MTYEFEYRLNTWDVTVVFLDEKTNRPPEGLADGVEIETYEIYQLKNFNSLNVL